MLYGYVCRIGGAGLLVCRLLAGLHLEVRSGLWSAATHARLSLQVTRPALKHHDASVR